ncbi:3-isopropylmalate dehydratase small subunit [Azospirillum sp. TSO35-2]|uniref:3-isopropylmalate dehydratase small subunit n=1 Tax=Azospirillum sp. TSO35-2 TaxID=716796 RepID=UPI000D61273F|nr:3-isopropylmalate dehydratase small subunit [Azospirillum sp. TSO35-2]PWC36482.1 3-isopropylmalate dehydratase [Azospirillum sp. TSO35-2]
MESFTIVSGTAAAIPLPNIDTDVIMPKQFLKGIDRSGLGEGAFHDLRFDAGGRERPDFILNRPGWRDAAFLVVGPNFGCGSSREHAVWGLKQRGVRALLGTSFAGIFFDNCARNGLLALTLDPATADALMEVAAGPEPARLTVDLTGCSIATADGRRWSFTIDAGRREALLHGRDHIATTLTRTGAIADFEAGHRMRTPWLP